MTHLKWRPGIAVIPSRKERIQAQRPVFRAIMYTLRQSGLLKVARIRKFHGCIQVLD